MFLRRLIVSCLLLAAGCRHWLMDSQSGAVPSLHGRLSLRCWRRAAHHPFAVTEWRLPRVLMALLTRARLGVSGAIFQSLMR